MYNKRFYASGLKMTSNYGLLILNSPRKMYNLNFCVHFFPIKLKILIISKFDRQRVSKLFTTMLQIHNKKPSKIQKKKKKSKINFKSLNFLFEN